jgi:UDP-N-acetylmuramyl pentapeptide phosphotransferase/UDP-N-acetylglucosamine-1-phosphate transferase
MEQIIIGGVLAFFSTYYAIPVIIKVAEAKKLYDEPDDVRKLHVKPIPSLGGLGMFIGFTLCVLLTTNFTVVPEFQYYIACFLIIFFVGIKDDILILSAMKKFIGQVIVAAILIFKANLVIGDMQGFLGLHQIDTGFSYFLTLFTIVVIINAFNLIDGVDGLAGSIGLISCLVFGTFFLMNGNISYAILAYGFAASVLAFLIYNFQPAKIFMGDTGSLILGLVNSILVIKFIETGAHYTAYPISAAPAVGFSIMLLPLMDTLRVFSIRILHGRSPFSPDRNHIHHLLLDRGLNHRSVTLTCATVCITFIAAGFLLQGFGTTWLILGLIFCFFSGIYGLYLTRAKVNMRVIRGERVENKFEIKEEKRVRLVSLFSRTPSPAVVEED